MVPKHQPTTGAILLASEGTQRTFAFVKILAGLSGMEAKATNDQDSRTRQSMTILRTESRDEINTKTVCKESGKCVLKRGL